MLNVIKKLKRVLSRNWFLISFMCITFLLILIPDWLKLQLAVGSEQPYWTCITSFFVHVSLIHWGSNMIALSLIIWCTNQIQKTKYILYLFFIGGMIANLVTMIFMSYYQVQFSLLGCSAGITVVLGYDLSKLANCWLKHCQIKYLKRVLIIMIILALMYLNPQMRNNLLMFPSFVVHCFGLLIGISYGLILDVHKWIAKFS